MNRLVPSPIFIISAIRSGSTLLRCILNSHSRLHAPHELHLTDLSVSITSTYAALAMTTSGLDVEELEHLLWDRVLHRSLQTSGKEHIVDKTPGNALRWSRLVNCWPHARFIFLLRHPAQTLQSAYEANPVRPPEETKDIVLRLMAGVEDARLNLPGLQVRYEQLTDQPHQVAAEICAHLGVSFEPTMLDYQVPEQLLPGIGDFTDKIRSGRVQPGRPFPAAIDPDLAAACRRWEYTDANS
jgi:hypothetical protein